MFDPEDSRTNGTFSFRYWRRHPIRAFRFSLRAWTKGMATLGNSSGLPVGCAEIMRRFDESEHNEKIADRHWYGGTRQRERVAALADHCLTQGAGDIIEIGACQGYCTRLLGEVAGRHGRKVIVIDPWIPGTQDCEGKEFEEFQENIRDVRKHVEVIRESSMSPAVFKQLTGRPIAFAFVDGLHTFEACWSDFRLVRETTGLIVADDARYNVEVLMAARIRARDYGWGIVQPPDVREAIMFPSRG